VSVALPLPWRPLALGLLVAAGGVLSAEAVGLLGPGSATGATAGYLLCCALIIAHWRQPRIGPANAVTLARVVGTCWAAGLTMEAAGGSLALEGRLVLVLIGSACLVLDGIDGRVARSRGEVSEFGARFDVETDAALLLALSMTVVALNVAGWWVLAIGGMRYAYVLASWMVPRLRTPTPGTLAGKVVAVVQGVALLLALVVDLVLPGRPAAVVLLVALGCLCWSFGRSIRWQLRAPGRAPSGFDLVDRV
jgi:phosphatidylglycerophosphate synthase